MLYQLGSIDVLFFHLLLLRFLRSSYDISLVKVKFFITTRRYFILLLIHYPTDNCDIGCRSSSTSPISKCHGACSSCIDNALKGYSRTCCCSEPCEHDIGTCSSDCCVLDHKSLISSSCY